MQIFAALWGTNELLTSMDSINCNPPGMPSPGSSSWLHTDQGPRRTTPLCIQVTHHAGPCVPCSSAGRSHAKDNGCRAW